MTLVVVANSVFLSAQDWSSLEGGFLDDIDGSCEKNMKSWHHLNSMKETTKQFSKKNRDGIDFYNCVEINECKLQLYVIAM